MDSIPFYRLEYVNRRNRYCDEHIDVRKHPVCNKCKNIALGKKKITVFEFDSKEEVKEFSKVVGLKGEMLELAAFLEMQVGYGEMKLHEARYLFVERFPLSNCLPNARRKFDYSVLSMIRPYFDTPQEIPKVTLRNGLAQMFILTYWC